MSRVVDSLELRTIFADLSLQWQYIAATFLGIIGFLLLVTVTNNYLIGGAFVLLIPLLVLFFQYPRLWLCASILLWVVWFRSSDEGVSALDVAMVGFYLGGLGAWFFSKILRRETIIRNTADRFMLLVFILTLANVVIAYFNGTSLLIWIREYLLFTFLLYYFPIREYFAEKKHLIVLLMVSAVAIFTLGIMNLQMYAKAATNAVYAFNILSSRVSMNETIFLGAALVSFAFLLYIRSWYGKLSFLFLTFFFASVLIASFTRGAWIAFIVGVMYLFVVIGKKKKILLSAYVFIGALSLAVIIMMFFGHLGNVIFQNIEERFFSATKGTRDASVKVRVIESQAAIDGIASHPLSGVGLGGRVFFYDVISETTGSPTFIHNGYLFLAYKLGIPITFMFVLSICLYIYEGFAKARLLQDILYKCTVMGATAALLAVLLVSITSNQFAIRHGISLISVYLALISIGVSRVAETQTCSVPARLLPASSQ